jgi:hypothetical protein
MTLPSLNRVSVTFTDIIDGEQVLLLGPFASAKEREILEVTMEEAIWLFD